MNEKHSRREWIYKPRKIAPALSRALAQHPVLVLTGARQTGKSTLLEEEPGFRNMAHVSFDDFEALARVEQDPASLWVGHDRVVLDEVQKAPKILPAIKRTVDARRRGVCFVLSGSSNLLLLNKVSESLAGRAVFFDLLPMGAAEWAGREPSSLLELVLCGQPPPKTFDPAQALPALATALHGFFPPLLELDTPGALSWFDGYVKTYLERDLRQVSQVSSLVDFRRAMEGVALRAGQVFNVSSLARDLGLSQPTLHRYLNLMQTTQLLHRLPAFEDNRGKRLVKAPKLYWLDPGLSCFLAGLHAEPELEKSREVGGIFETLTLLNLRVGLAGLTPAAQLFYFRTQSGLEVDSVVQHGRKLLAVEAKLTDRPRYGDAQNMVQFLEDHPQTIAGLVVHSGKTVTQLHEKIWAVPWWQLS